MSLTKTKHSGTYVALLYVVYIYFNGKIPHIVNRVELEGYHPWYMPLESLEPHPKYKSNQITQSAINKLLFKVNFNLFHKMSTEEWLNQNIPVNRSALSSTERSTVGQTEKHTISTTSSARHGNVTQQRLYLIEIERTEKNTRKQTACFSRLVKGKE